jgi:hypothetical protein
MDRLIQLANAIYSSFCGWFYSGYGDPQDSQCGNLDIEIGATDWKPLLSMTYPCILYIRNRSVDVALLQYVEWTWNKAGNQGAYMGYDEGFVFDKVLGTLYVRSGDVTKTASINFATVSLKHTEQNI